METHKGVSDRGGRTFQRFSVDTNESLHFEPCEDSSPSPTGIEHDEDNVFIKDENEVKIPRMSVFVHLLYLKQHERIITFI